MNYQEALTYIHTNFWKGSKPGLSRTKELLGKMGDPQDALRFIHVAGTNGKGSFCAMLSSILIEAGFKVGTYTSPYIVRFNERMKINGADIPDDTLAELTDYVRPFAESMAEKPTEFELITAVGMEYFKREKCDLVVLECGMGGRLDSTNIIRTPLLSVITGISLEHTAYLGNTVEAIAGEKAGIIKPGIPVLFCGKDPAAERVIREKAREQGSPYHAAVREGLTVHKMDLSGTAFSWNGWDGIEIPLLGTYQTENAVNVLTAVSLLREGGISIPDEAVFAGMKKVRWPARFEKVSDSPLVICDGGHNPEGVDVASESVKRYFGSQKLLIVTGVMADKDHRRMTARLAEVASQAFCLTPDNPRALDAADLAAEFIEAGVPAAGYPSPLEALRAAVKETKAEDRPILCVGSLYMYKEVREALEEILG